MRDLFNFKKGLSLMIILITSASAFAQWTTVGSTNFSLEPVWAVSLAINSNGVPYVAYIDGSNGNKITVKKLNDSGTEWETVGIKGFSAGSASQIKLIIKDNVPYVFFVNQRLYEVNTDIFYEDTAIVMKFNGTAWVNVGTVDTPHYWFSNMDIVFDSANNLYISFSHSDDNNNYLNIVKKFNINTINWETVGAAFSSGVASWSKLSFDNANVPFIVFFDETNNVHVKKYNGLSWVIVDTPNLSLNSMYPPSAVLNNNVLYVSFLDNDTEKASVMKINSTGKAWEFLGPEGFTPNYVNSQSLSFYNGTPYISFTNSTTSKPSLMKFNGTSWEFVGIASTPQSYTSYYPSLAFNSTGVPYIAYATYAYSPITYVTVYGGGGVMKYISETSTGVNSKSIEPTIKTNPNPTTGKFSLSMDNTISKSVDVQINNTVGEVILKKTVVTDRNTEFDLTNYPKGVYLLQINADKQIISQKIVLQ